MPTLDDAPILENLPEVSIDENDLIQVYDVSAQKVKTLKFSDLLNYIVSNTDANLI